MYLSMSTMPHAPIQKAIFKSGSDVGKIISFIGESISDLLKSNDYVERALINACIRLLGVLTTDANNIKHFPLQRSTVLIRIMSNRKTSDWFNEKFKIHNQMANIRGWYDGYCIVNSKLKMYNIYSIVNYLESLELKNY